jgi:CPA1 family monovalent cation:H+ antiporter
MQKFWEFFAFLANSIVFILMRLILSHIDIDILYFVPAITLSIIVIAFARAVSVY